MASKKASGMLRRYVVRTKAKEELRAEANLNAWAIETFAPRVREERINQFTGLPTFHSKVSVSEIHLRPI